MFAHSMNHVKESLQGSKRGKGCAACLASLFRSHGGLISTGITLDSFCRICVIGMDCYYMLQYCNTWYSCVTMEGR